MNLRLTLFLIAGITLRLAAQSSQDLRFRMSGFHTEPASARLFDPQSGFNLSAPSGNDAYTCALYFQGRFWTGGFDGPMIRRFSVGGSLVDSLTITGLPDTGTTAITTDGSCLYIAQDQGIYLYEVNPSTLAVTDSILLPLFPKGVAYDSTRDAFWVAYDDYPMVLFDRTGATLQTIPSAVHGLAGIYGLAFDAVTSGGPYLWAFARITPDGLHRIVRIPVASGIPDGVSFPVMHRLGDQLAYGQAGGLSIANGLAPGRLSLVGVLQGVPDDLLFSVELSSDSLLAADAAMDTLRLSPPYTRVPLALAQAYELEWNCKFRNVGTDTLDVVEVQAALYDSLQSLLVNTTRSVAAMAPADRSSGHFPTGFHPSATGRIRVVASLLSTPADQFTPNDSLDYRFEVSDSTLAYDEGPAFTGLGLGNGGRVGQSFELPVGAEISSITFSLEAPVAGDSLYAELWTFNGAPGNLIVRTLTYHVPPAYVAGTPVTLPLESGLFPLNDGEYFVCLREHTNSASLSSNWKNYRYRKAWAKSSFGSWQPMEASDLFVGFRLQVNIRQIVNALNSIAPTSGIRVFPNPTQRDLQVISDQPIQGRLLITDLQGRRLCESSATVEHDLHLSLDGLASGVYLLQTEAGNCRILKTD